MQKIFKKILVFLLCVVAIVCCIPFEKLSADTGINYSIVEIYYVDHTNIIRFYATYNDNTSRWVWNDDNLYTKYSYYEDNIYPVEQLIEIRWHPYEYNLNIVVIDDYSSDLTFLNANAQDLFDSGYTQGYNIGSQNTNTESFDAGYQSGFREGMQENSSDAYDEGYREGLSQFDYGTTGYDEIFNAGRIAGRSESVDNSGFYGMLRQIALYPVDIFTEGLDIDIFGVNVGGFLLGFGILALIFFIIRKLTGGR